MRTIDTGVTERGLNGAVFPALQEAAALWKLICTLLNSTGSKEEYKWLGQVPTPREWLGRREAKPLRDFEQTLVNKHWESTLEIDRDEFADDETGQLQIRARDMGRRFARHPDKLLCDLIQAGDTSLCYDGQYFYDDDHTEGVSGSQSNKLTGAIADKDNPTPAEFKVAFGTCVEAMMGFKDDEGEPINDAFGNHGMGGLVATVPVNMFQAALEALTATILAMSSNVVISQAKVFAVPRFTASDVFYVHKTDDPVGPFIYQLRQKVETHLLDDPTEKGLLYLLDGRYAVGYGLWQKSVRYQFTTA